MAINKVEFGNQTLIDLTADTVTASDVASGVTFHNAAGEAAVGTASGSGDVVDVEVNGVSVVDENKVAQITSYKEVTLAEYIALGDVVNTDGKLYCITDLNNSDVQGYPPLIYSDEEREIGVWRDGKPLYQKTIYFGALPNNAVKSVAHGISDIDTIATIEGTIIRTSDKDTLPVPHVSALNIAYGIQCSAGVTSINIRTGSDQTNRVAYMTIRYTKTTDVAGSGIWNGQGGYAHHYSTSEQLIGTWIDGKPLYERTKVVSFANFTHNNDTYFTPIASDNTETLRNVEAIAYSTGYGVCTLGSRAYSRDNTLSYYWELVEYYSNVALHFVGESVTDVGVTEVVITYRYTKTTD